MTFTCPSVREQFSFILSWFFAVFLHLNHKSWLFAERRNRSTTPCTKVTISRVPFIYTHPSPHAANLIFAILSFKKSGIHWTKAFMLHSTRHCTFSGEWQTSLALEIKPVENMNPFVWCFGYELPTMYWYRWYLNTTHFKIARRLPIPQSHLTWELASSLTCHPYIIGKSSCRSHWFYCARLIHCLTAFSKGH